jgi:hypothetical protein
MSTLYATKVHAEDYVLGRIELGVTATNLCAVLTSDDTLTIKSMGGSVSEAQKLADCVHSTNALVRLKVGYSAATLVAMAANRVCFYEGAGLGYHSAYYKTADGDIKPLGIDELRYSMYLTMQLLRTYGYTPQQVLLIAGVTMMTPPESISVLPTHVAIELLGSRYVGACAI